MVGRAAVAITKGRHLMLSDLLYRVRLWEAFPAFVKESISSCSVREQVEECIRTDSGQTLKLRTDDVKGLIIPSVPLDKQRVVYSLLAERLQPIQTLVGVLERQIVLLYKHRQALITAAVTGELDVAGRMAGLRHGRRGGAAAHPGR
jgi:type I restriction enzyme S subunit